MVRQGDVVVPVHAEDFLHHITLAVHVNHVAGCQHDSLATLIGYELILQGLEHAGDVLMTYLLADERLNAVVVQLNALALDTLGVDFYSFSNYMATGELADKHSSTFEGIGRHLRIRFRRYGIPGLPGDPDDGGQRL